MPESFTCPHCGATLSEDQIRALGALTEVLVEIGARLTTVLAEAFRLAALDAAFTKTFIETLAETIENEAKRLANRTE